MGIRDAYLQFMLAVGLSLGAAAACAEPLPRIVSLSPHITELLFAAGAGERIVGVDDLSDYPPAAAAIAHVGEITALDIEALLKLKPTLIILWESGTPERRKAELERLNLRLYVTEQRHLDDIGSSLIEFGRLAGCRGRGAQVSGRITAAANALCGAAEALGVLSSVGSAAIHTLGQAGVERGA
jgi:iron complex transport system substrate-binding protein